MTQNLKGQLALVTGASRGIGRAAALALAEAGADIIAVARPRSKGQLEDLDDAIQALGGHCTIVPMELRDGDAIDRLGGALYERWGKLDIMIANAAILGPISPVDHVEPKEWTEVFDINLTANFRLIRSMHPLLKASGAGRALFMTSGAAGKNKPFWGPYAASKAALEELVHTYAAENKEVGAVKAMLLDPGPIRTHMRASAVPGEDPSTLPEPSAVAELIVKMVADTDGVDVENGGIMRFYDWAGIKR